MTQKLSVRRWIGFLAATALLSTGILLLSVQASDVGLAPRPDRDDESYVSGEAAQPALEGSLVVDRLNTWAETKGKKQISPAKGGGKRK